MDMTHIAFPFLAHRAVVEHGARLGHQPAWLWWQPLFTLRLDVAVCHLDHPFAADGGDVHPAVVNWPSRWSVAATAARAISWST